MANSDSAFERILIIAHNEIAEAGVFPQPLTTVNGVYSEAPLPELLPFAVTIILSSPIISKYPFDNLAHNSGSTLIVVPSEATASFTVPSFATFF
jgi:hypothetical protein